MASISSLMGSSSSSSIYGSRNSNIISGLASGLDTESMIEGMLQGYKSKITGLQQDRQSLLWQQQAYQSISDKLVEFSRKYMSYTSSTNLLSSSFFNNAVLTTTGGKFADMVSATGKTSSNITIDAVAQLATAARYTSGASSLGGAGGKLTAGDEIHMDQDTKLSTLEGSMTISYGNKDVTIDFSDTEFFDPSGNGTGNVSAEKLKDAIVKKLSEEKITLSSGDQKAASELIDVQVSGDGTISFSDKTSGQNDVKISSVSGQLKDSLGLTGDALGSLKVDQNQSYTETVKAAEALEGKSITITLDGTKKTISFDSIIKDENGDYIQTNDAFKDNLQEALNKAFGTGKVEVGLDGDKLTFEAQKNSTLAVSSTAGNVLGFENGLTSYVNTSLTLSQLGTYDASSGKLTIGGVELQGTLMEAVPKDEWVKQEDGTYKDADGYKLDSDGYRLNDDGQRLYEFSLTVNGTEVGKFNQDTALETVMNSINSNTEAGVNVSYSKLTNEFVFTAKQTGEGGQIEAGDGTGNDLATALFGKSDGKVTEGQDAIFKATVNGSTMYFSRSPIPLIWTACPSHSRERLII